MNTDKIHASILGLAIGDALGAPLTGLKQGRVKQLFGEFAGYVDAREAWADRPHRWHLPGLHTCETQQALSIIDVLCETGDAEARAVKNLWGRLVHGARQLNTPHGVFRGAGQTFSRALGSKDREAMPQPSAGSSAATRAVPVGLILNDPDRINELVIDLTWLTHTDPRALAGALTVAHAASLLSRADEPIDATAIMNEIIARVFAGEEKILIDLMGELPAPPVEAEVDPIHAMSHALGAVAALVKEGDDDLALRTLIRQGNHLSPDRPLSSPNVGFAPVTITVALYFALAHAQFSSAVAHLASEGKEASTSASIAGALLGARLGTETIPRDWRDGLIAHADILRFGEALSGARNAADRPSLLDMETALTQREIIARAPLEAALAKQQARDEKRAASRPQPKPKPKPPEDLPFAPPPQTYLHIDEDDPTAKRKERAARGRKRVDWKEERRQRRRD